MVREYKRYDEYKDSGIEWLGEIPKDWDITKLKYITTVNMGQSVNSATVNIIKKGVPFLQGNAEFGDLNPKEKHYTTEPKKIANKNEILISVRAPVGDLNIADKKYCIGRGLCAIKPKNNLLFLYELLKISKIYFDKISTGSTYDSISTKDLKNIKLPKPSKKEQQKIASFLDQKTAEIDEIINKKEKLINYLEKYKKSVITEAVTKGKLGDKYINEDGELVDEIEMKDSGVEWIGEIPEYWDISKVKYIADIHGRIGYRGYTKDDLVDKGNGALTLGGKHIDDNNKIDLSDPTYISWEKYYESPEIMVKYNDLLVVQRGSIGKVAMIDKEIGEATINPSLILINNIEIEPKYFYYYLNSFSVSEFFKLIVSSTAVPMISQEQFDNLHLPKMNLDIQQKIVSYLKQKTQQIDNLIQKTKKSIEKYKKYKKSLIFEAVTGKIDLRDYELEGGEELAEHNNSSETERERLSAVD
ncbi:type I restriction enzyme, S subunit [Halanaerobium congolense]|jgi:type I restriction enzyme S subunit|uniref:Type I restriction enzyme, S subunit n=1 Tax=Halanaerobium congolense TaxID=54121 RepID=A0A1I0ABB2_9FIRM|nr:MULTISPECIES: restriction endonuclease subunit S [Halanaerobium]PTX15883.1 type I restriction enzyme S subunit [Halanaerobium congolense]PUU88592.1 MAG: type I restriction enzyme, S subunit [Halanaerobium sp.]SDF38115.1 type I restriction enzyme, S subunit [Halanaerobium congolense]SES91015.1 type I restriction enzyme, S subunit [Halanaerobium congolense]SFP21756.1 type I restriction enzyme, S subunit [Halanaerobium congolense]